MVVGLRIVTNPIAQNPGQWVHPPLIVAVTSDEPNVPMHKYRGLVQARSTSNKDSEQDLFGLEDHFEKPSCTAVQACELGDKEKARLGKYRGDNDIGFLFYEYLTSKESGEYIFEVKLMVRNDSVPVSDSKLKTFKSGGITIPVKLDLEGFEDTGVTVYTKPITFAPGRKIRLSSKFI